MPNHIKNKIELIGNISDIDAMITAFGTQVEASIKMTDDSLGDNPLVICRKKGTEWGFCWLDLKTGRVHNRNGMDQIGLPDDYEIEINQGFLCFPDFEKIIPPPNTEAYKDKPSQQIAKNESTWWYNWNIENWGTKWSGYSYKREALNIFTFETAWSSVPLIIDALSKANPKVTIKYSWADEDTGYNCGRAIYHNGLIEEDVPKGGSVKAYELAFELRPNRALNYQLVDGKYQYKEDSE
jgi:hypothetical protein